MDSEKIFDDVIIHHGVKGMKWGVRRRQKKAAKYDKASKKAQREGDSQKATRLHSKSRSYVQGTPEYTSRTKKNAKRIIVGTAIGLRLAPMLLSNPNMASGISKGVVGLEKTRLRFLLRNDFRFQPNDSDTARMITSGMDFVAKRFGSYNISSL